jgi:hypothetical protein
MFTERPHLKRLTKRAYVDLLRTASAACLG